MIANCAGFLIPGSTAWTGPEDLFCGAEWKFLPDGATDLAVRVQISLRAHFFDNEHACDHIFHTVCSVD